MYKSIHPTIYLLFEFSSSGMVEIKLLDLPVITDFAKDNALLACKFALEVHLANREFFLDLECLFFGTAICITCCILFYFKSYMYKKSNIFIIQSKLGTKNSKK